jgi:hypothetical protein
MASLKIVQETRLAWGCDRGEGTFFGDFLCASKESYPPTAEAFDGRPVFASSRNEQKKLRESFRDACSLERQNQIRFHRQQLLPECGLDA